MKAVGKKGHFEAFRPIEIYANKLPYSFGAFSFILFVDSHMRPAGLAASRAPPRFAGVAGACVAR